MSDLMNDQRTESVWVYGVIPAGAELKELGRRRDRLPSDVRVEEVGDLGVIIGNLPENTAKATRDQALAHARVLEAAVVDTPVVPFRFGMVVGKNELGSDLLEGRHDELRQTLERIKDHVQFTLKVSYLEDEVLSEIVASDPAIAQLREQTRGLDEIATRDIRIRLGEMVSIALESHRQQDAHALLERLSPFASSFTVDPLEAEFMVVNAPFLIERRRMQDFDQAASMLAEEQAGRMHFTLLGPMPAYDFVGAGSPAWA
jgi:Gas vesicle synthesis protein GvpL/GvpF